MFFSLSIQWVPWSLALGPGPFCGVPLVSGTSVLSGGGGTFVLSGVGYPVLFRGTPLATGLTGCTSLPPPTPRKGPSIFPPPPPPGRLLLLSPIFSDESCFFLNVETISNKYVTKQLFLTLLFEFYKIIFWSYFP